MKELCKKLAALYLCLGLILQPAWPVPQVNVPAAGGPKRPATLLPGQSVTLLPDGRWLMLGGEGARGPVSTAVIQTPTTESVATVNTGMRLARAWHSATLLPDGQVLVVGGKGTDAKMVQTAELFDPNSRTSRTVTIQLQPRAHHTATLLTDGRVLIAGGIGADGAPSAAVELWDSRSNGTSVIPAALTSERKDHFASLLPNGTALLWGGTDALGNPISYADLYDPDRQSFTSTTFIIPPVPDLNVPFLETSLPTDGASEVEPNALISLRFSKPMQVETVNPVSVKLNGPSGPVSARVVPTESGMLCFVTPNYPLQAGATYLLSLQGPTDTRDLRLVYKTVSFTMAGKSSQTNGGSSGTGSGDSPDVSGLPPLIASPGVTAISGQTLQLNGKPLANVAFSIGNKKTKSDRTGRFLLENIGEGHQVLDIEGRTANTKQSEYGFFEAGLDIVAGRTNLLDYKIWMAALDMTHAVTISSPTEKETVITSPLIPGLELHIPPKTIIRDHYGHVVTKISITQIPLDRTPFPLPKVQVPLYFTIQPGGAYLKVESGGQYKGARLFYPNSVNALPGTRFAFWNYDADHKGWYVYGLGTVTPDRQEVVPDPGVEINEFTGAMVNNPGPPPPGGPTPGGPHRGEPVDPSTGLFVYQFRDVHLPDVIPIDLERSYRQGDTVSRDFGMGTSLNYEVYLVGDKNPYTYQDLILADGGRIHYERISPGTTWTDAVYQHTTSPTEFYGSTINWNPNRKPNGGWDLHFKGGSMWAFPESSSAGLPQQAAILYMQDRWGNVLNIARGSNSNITQITSPNGRWLQFTYDTCNRITQITDNIDRSTIYAYDSGNCNVAGHLHTVTDPNQGITTYNYGENGAATDEMTSIVDARQIKYLQNSYDSNGRVHLQTLANNGTYRFAYATDGSGNITQTSVTDPNNNVDVINYSTPAVFQSGYQTGGYETSEILAQGKPEQQTFTYDYGTPANNPGNFVLNLTDPLNRITNYSYDAMGNVTSVTWLATTSSAATTALTYEPTFNRLAGISDALGDTTSFAYNDSTNQTTKTDPTGSQTVVLYDSYGRPLSVTDALQESWTFSYTGPDLTALSDPLHNTTNYLYDGAGRLITTVDPLGNRTTYAYDALNNLVGITDPLGNATKFGYDANRFLTTFSDPLHTAAPTVYSPNSMDQLQKRTDPLGHWESYGYDLSLNGNVTCYTDRNGNSSIFQYDGINRRTVTGYGAANCTAQTFASSVTYGYDGGNRLHTANDSSSGLITRNYDGLNSLQSESTTLAGANHMVTYQNDSARRRTSMTVDSQQPVTYSYDAASRVTQITQGTASVSFTYDAAGRRTSMTLPNGVVAQYMHDAASHLTGITYQIGATTLGNLTYAYDAGGRITQKGGSFANTNLPAVLSSATYNVDNQLTAWGSNNAYTYDSDGNLKTDGINTYMWNERNHLGSITGGTPATFQYDALGRRIGKTLAGIATTLLYDKDNIVNELSGATATATMLNGLRVDETYSRTDASGPRYLLSDLLGSTIALTDSAAAIQTQYGYDPFGSTTVTGATNANPFQYTGRENDTNGLYFYRARYYQPSRDKFMSEDPLEFRAGSNFYSYVNNDPVLRRDPFGLAQDCESREDCATRCLLTGFFGIFCFWYLPPPLDLYCFAGVVIFEVGCNVYCRFGPPTNCAPDHPGCGKK